MAEIDESREEARRNTRGRFEQWAKNPKCEANALSAVHNIRMDKAAELIGLTPSFGQSPFAIARGNTFERGLFDADAERLRKALERKGCLPDESTGLVDLRLRMNGGRHIASVEAALAATQNWLESVVDDPENAASIVASPMIKIPRGVILPEALLIIDLATVRFVSNKPTLTVGEIKVFPDRGGHTDPGQLATARAQAGLYQRALELAVESSGFAREIRVASDGILIFTWPGSNQPSVRAGEDLRYQAIRAERGFERLEEIASSIVRHDDFAADLPHLLERVVEAETSYSEACLSFCDLAPRCHQRALDSDDGLVLGTEAGRVLGDVSITRAIKLLNGAEPANDREVDLQRQLGAS